MRDAVVRAGAPVGDVGVLRDHDHGARRAITEVSAADRDARTGEAGSREHPGRRGLPVGGDHHDVVGAVLDTGGADVAGEALR